MITLKGSRAWPHIEDVLVLEGYRLRLWFDDGKVGDVDLSHLVGAGPVFEAFADPEFFSRVRIEPVFGTVVWPGEIDLAPETLYEDSIAVQPPPPRPNPPKPSPESSAPETAETLPEICRFLGMVIKMFWTDHARPHFHVEYAEFEARIAIQSPALINGELPPRVLGLAIEWAASHQEELLENWDRARRYEPLKKIAPLE